MKVLAQKAAANQNQAVMRLPVGILGRHLAVRGCDQCIMFWNIS